MNKKIKNAAPIEQDGIKFRSKLELRCYTKLKENNIDFKYEEHKFILIPKFTYMEENIRAITYTPDFTGDNWIIECKG